MCVSMCERPTDRHAKKQEKRKNIYTISYYLQFIYDMTVLLSKNYTYNKNFYMILYHLSGVKQGD